MPYASVKNASELCDVPRSPKRRSMKNGTQFTVLIERRRHPQTSLAWWMTLLVLAALALMPRMRAGKPVAFHPHAKIARDLQDAMAPDKGRPERWSRRLHGIQHVEAIIVSNSIDPEMSDLRAQVRRAGGKVVARHRAVHAITVQVPAARLAELA